MAGFRRTRYLTCFYCGRRTSTPYDGIVRQFTCTRCEATNYLDKNGDITDPPVATTSAATSPPSFARQKSPSPGLLSMNGDFGTSFTSTFDGEASTNNNNVFCATCLKNQHLFVSSLAQYFPPDPNHPDFAELERKYFRFRKSLERRYPQVCADCEPAVLERIRQAGYTAKTDHLERMVRYSRQVRVTRPTLLDHASRIGHWLWWFSLFFQVLWQLGVVGVLATPLSASVSDDQGFGDDAVLDDAVLSDAVVGDEPSTPAVSWSAEVSFGIALPVLHWAIAHVDRLRSLCIGATVASCWWNPYFVQTVRGFTKPFIGISTWYTYQAALVFVRIVMSKMSGGQSSTTDDEDALPQLPPALLGCHAFAAIFTLYIYMRAPGSIRKDLRPLFAKSDDPPLSTPPKQRQQQQQSRRAGETQTLSDVLDEISSTPTPKPPVSTRGALDSNRWQSSRLGTTSPSGDSPAWLRRQKSNFELGTLNISRERATPLFLTPKTEENPYGYSEEMDWTPSQPAEPVRSPYRAFSAEPALPSSGSFSQTPAGTNRGTFWYKVPPAPTSIAKRVLNPPNAPRLFQSGGGSMGKEKAAQSSATASGSFFSHHDQLNLRPSAVSTPAANVEFAQPRFFASNVVGRRASEDEAGNSLSDLFSQSFTLGNEEAEVETEEDTDSQESPNSRRGHKRKASLGGRQPKSMASVVQRVLWGGVLALSLQLVRGLRTGRLATATTNTGLNDVVHRAQPFAPVIETAAVGLCAATAVVLTRESMQRWQRAATARRRPNRQGRVQGPAQWPEVIGCLLGVLGIGLSAWMVMEREGAGKGGPLSWLSSGQADAEEAPSMLDDDIQSTVEAGRPWQWWQLAAVHGLVLGHQVWNMVWE